MKTKRYFLWLMTGALVLTGLVTTSCKDQPDKYEVADGTPTVYYVRSPYLSQRDSLLTGAYMGNTICLVGDNLRSIVELYFNDRPAVLNTSYITDNTLICDVPNELPDNPTDKIYMKTQSGETVSYDFAVLIPQPTVSSMSNEFAKPGEEATIYGDYFLSYDSDPLSITMPGNVAVTDIKSISKTAVTFVIPDGVSEAGRLNVTTKYGTSKSKFFYLDNRNTLFDFDGKGEALASGNGWRAGNIRNDENSVDGGYLYLGGATLDGDFGKSWEEDAFCMNYWPTDGKPQLSEISTMKQILATNTLDKLLFKFEVQVPTASKWSAHAMQIMLTKEDMVNSNAYYGNTELPRALWMPWTLSGSFDTANQWQTISIPLTNFNRCNDGSTCGTSLSVDFLAGLTLFVWHGGINGETCSPEFYIDNIRIVPAE